MIHPCKPYLSRSRCVIVTNTLYQVCTQPYQSRSRCVCRYQYSLPSMYTDLPVPQSMRVSLPILSTKYVHRLTCPVVDACVVTNTLYQVCTQTYLSRSRCVCRYQYSLPSMYTDLPVPQSMRVSLPILSTKYVQVCTDLPVPQSMRMSLPILSTKYVHRLTCPVVDACVVTNTLYQVCTQTYLSRSRCVCRYQYSLPSMYTDKYVHSLTCPVVDACVVTNTLYQVCTQPYLSRSRCVCRYQYSLPSMYTALPVPQSMRVSLPILSTKYVHRLTSPVVDACVVTNTLYQVCTQPYLSRSRCVCRYQYSLPSMYTDLPVPQSMRVSLPILSTKYVHRLTSPVVDACVVTNTLYQVCTQPYLSRSRCVCRYQYSLPSMYTDLPVPQSMRVSLPILSTKYVHSLTCPVVDACVVTNTLYQVCTQTYLSRSRCVCRYQYSLPSMYTDLPVPQSMRVSLPILSTKYVHSLTCPVVDACVVTNTLYQVCTQTYLSRSRCVCRTQSMRVSLPILSTSMYTALRSRCVCRYQYSLPSMCPYQVCTQPYLSRSRCVCRYQYSLPSMYTALPVPQSMRVSLPTLSTKYVHSLTCPVVDACVVTNTLYQVCTQTYLSRSRCVCRYQYSLPSMYTDLPVPQSMRVSLPILSTKYVHRLTCPVVDACVVTNALYQVCTQTYLSRSRCVCRYQHSLPSMYTALPVPQSMRVSLPTLSTKYVHSLTCPVVDACVVTNTLYQVCTPQVCVCVTNTLYQVCTQTYLSRSRCVCRYQYSLPSMYTALPVPQSMRVSLPTLSTVCTQTYLSRSRCVCRYQYCPSMYTALLVPQYVHRLTSPVVDACVVTNTLYQVCTQLRHRGRKFRG